MSLIRVAPNAAKYALAPDQYTALVAKLKADPEVSGLDLVAGQTAGACTYQKITFSWIYDGAAELMVDIREDHNWKAEIAGNDAIFGTLNDKFIKPAQVAVIEKEMLKPE